MGCIIIVIMLIFHAETIKASNIENDTHKKRSRMTAFFVLNITHFANYRHCLLQP